MILAEGGNALEAMVAMAATIAAVYPHMNHIGGDGFWLVREPSGRVRALMGAGPAGAKATPAFYREHGHDTIPPRGPLAALTVPGGDRDLDAGAGRRQGASRPAAARRAARRRDQARAGLHGHAQPGAAHRREACRMPGRAGLRRDVPGRRQAAGRRRDAEAGRACRDARSARQCGPGGFLSRRCRARDRRRSRAHRLAGDARRSRADTRRSCASRSPSRCRPARSTTRRRRRKGSLR